jgi:hypothetical protein
MEDAIEAAAEAAGDCRCCHASSAVGGRRAAASPAGPPGAFWALSCRRRWRRCAVAPFWGRAAWPGWHWRCSCRVALLVCVWGGGGLAQGAARCCRGSPEGGAHLPAAPLFGSRARARAARQPRRPNQHQPGEPHPAGPVPRRPGDAHSPGAAAPLLLPPGGKTGGKSFEEQLGQELFKEEGNQADRKKTDDVADDAFTTEVRGLQGLPRGLLGWC